MIEIRPAGAAEFPAQKELWKTCFGDGDRFIELFFGRYCAPEDTVVLLEDGSLRSMAAVLPTELHFPDGTAAEAGYIYGLCTHPSSRNQGFVRELLNYADFRLRKQGKGCVTLVPAEPSLHRFFGMLGYEECFSVRETEYAPAEPSRRGGRDTAAAVGPEEYNRLREGLLKGRLHVAYPCALLAFQSDFSALSGGSLYRLELDAVRGCAVAERLGADRVLVRELLVPPGYAARAADVLSRTLPAARYYLRTPPFEAGLPSGRLQPFGMVKWLDARLERIWKSEREGYLGLGFD